MPVWGLVLCFTVAVCWAVSPVLMKAAMSGAGANEVNPIRSIGYLGCTAAVLWFFQPWYIPPFPAEYFFPLVANVFLGNILGDVLYIISIRMIGVSLAVSISCAYPLITTITSLFVLPEKITLAIWGGTISIVAGLLAVHLGSRTAAMARSEEDVAADARVKVRGFLLAVAAAVCWGVNIPFVKRIMVGAGWSPTEYYFYRSVFFFVMVWIIWLLQKKFMPRVVVPLKKIPPRAWLALIAAGAVSLSVGGLLFALCIQYMPVAIVTPITASSPFVTILIARFTHKERLSRLQTVGVALIVAGSIIVSI